MGMTDPIADLLTRMRNAMMVRHEAVEVPASKVKERIVALLKEEGFVRDYSMLPTKPQGSIRIELKYYDEGKPAIIGLNRVVIPDWHDAQARAVGREGGGRRLARQRHRKAR